MLKAIICALAFLLRCSVEHIVLVSVASKLA